MRNFKKILSCILLFFFTFTLNPVRLMAYEQEETKIRHEEDEEIISGNSYIISSKRNGKSIEVSNSSLDNGGQVQQWESTNRLNERWKIEFVTDNYFKIINNYSGKVLDVKDAATYDGASIHQWDYTGKDNQLWYFEKDKDGYCKIKSKQSEKCLDISGVSNENGAKIQLWSDVDGDNQKWKLTEVEIDKNILSGQTYLITSKRSNKAIKVDNGNVIQSEKTNDLNERWVLEKVSLEFYKLVNKNTNKVLQVKDGSTFNGALVEEGDYLEGDNQLWYLEKDNDGYYKIKSKQSKKVLDIVGISAENGAKLQIWDDVNGDNQKWNLELTEIDYDKIDMTKDGDNDGLADDLEILMGTLPNNADSDNDGISDYDEAIVLGTDPLSFDSDEDKDNDGLTNIEELKYSGNPFSADTDGDGLTDYEEYKLGTSFNNEDSDNDGILDYDEVKVLGTNPLIADSNGNGINDGEEVYSVTKTTDNENESEVVNPSIKIDLQGSKINTISILKISNDDSIFSGSIPGYIDNGYEVNSLESTNGAEIAFEIKNSDLTINDNFVPTIYYYNEETKNLVPLDNQNIKDNVVYGTLNDAKKYILLNKVEFEKAFDSKVENPIIARTYLAFYSAAPVNKTVDSNSDGISDYYTDQIYKGTITLGNGSKKYKGVNFAKNADYDGDGLKNGNEIKIAINSKGKAYIKEISNPTIKDSDGDGLVDKNDKNPLVWDVCDRDLAMFAALTYEKYNTSDGDFYKSIKGTSTEPGEKFYFLNFASANEVKNRWKIVDYTNEKISDNAYFTATTYKNDKNVVIAIRGTNDGFGEWYQNIVGYGLLNTHSEEANAKKLAVKIADKYPDCNIYITGHSLGGYLTQFVAAEMSSKRPKVNIAKVSYFNGMGINFNKVLSFFYNKNKSVINELKKLNNKNKLISYYINGDCVSSLGTHYGQKIGFPATNEAIANHVGKEKSWITWKAAYALNRNAVKINGVTNIMEYFWITHETDSFFKYLKQGTRGV